MIPSVSVIMPSYNHAAYVAEAIRSVLDQSYGDLEIVITDDGSRDGTPEVIRRIDDPRISLEAFDRNQGAAAAMNASIGRSRGEFICMLASDDCFLPGKLEAQVKFLRANPEVAAVFAMPRFIDQRGAPLGDSFNGNVFQVPFAKKLRTRPDWLRHFFYEGNCLCHPASMVRRAVYDRIGLFDRRLANLPDFDMWVRLCMEHEIRVVPDELIAMRILDGNRNMSAPRRDHNLRAVIEYFHILKHYRGLPRAMITQIFAREIVSAKLDAEGPVDVLLGELALLGAHPQHKFFALDSMFEAMRDAGDPTRLIELTGAIDVFAIETVRAAPRLLEQVAEAQADAARTIELKQRLADRLHGALRETYAAATRLEDQLDTEQTDRAQAAARANALSAEVLQVRDEAAQAQADAARTIELKQRLADRLHGALQETYAEATRLDDQLGTEQIDRARMISALQAIQDHASTITTRSRAYRLLRLLTRLRGRIEMIAGEAARALHRG
jgi:glycosyltransferase involved in cell wall biosynthesis